MEMNKSDILSTFKPQKNPQLLGLFYFVYFLKSLSFINVATARKITTRNINNAAEIHVGDSTHHQDHSITFSSLSVINTICNSPQNPMPPLAVGLLLSFGLLIYYSFTFGFLMSYAIRS